MDGVNDAAVSGLSFLAIVAFGLWFQTEKDYQVTMQTVLLCEPNITNFESNLMVIIVGKGKSWTKALFYGQVD